MKTSGKGGQDAQNGAEMLAAMQDACEAGKPPRRGLNIYKPHNSEYHEEQLRALIQCGIDDFLAPTATKGRVSLDNAEEVQKRMVAYLRACSETATFPSSLGFARSIGYTDRALRYWRTNKPDTPTGELLERFNDMCSELLTQSALNNNANTVYSIFLGKALYGLRDTVSIEIPTPPSFEERGYDPAEIRKRYMVDEGAAGV